MTDEIVAISKYEYERIMDENTVLWSIFKTCMGCKNLVPGVVYGCDIQKHIDLSGYCNQKEELPWDKTVILMDQFITFMHYVTPDMLSEKYSFLQSLMNDFAGILWEVRGHA